MADQEGSRESTTGNAQAPGVQPPVAGNTLSEERAWLMWIRKYKDIIEVVSMVVGIVVAFVSLYFIQRQLSQLASNDEVVSKQTSLLADQVEAMWYGNRPSLRILPPNVSFDITPFSKSRAIRTQLPDFTTPADSTLFTLNYTIENVGNSAAALDTTYTDLGIGTKVWSDTTVWNSDMISPRDQSVCQTSLPIVSGVVNWLKLTIVYRWDTPNRTEDRFECTRCLRIDRSDGAWHIYKVPPGMLPASLR